MTGNAIEVDEVMAIRICRWIMTAVMSLGVAHQAMACAFHGYTPNPTLVDLLLATEQVVIARPDTANQNRYKLTETLLGADILEIPLRVDPEIRKRLTSLPSATVLLARDGAYGPWQEVAVLDQRYRRVVEHVLQRQSAWLWGGDKERLSFFAKLLNDPNPDIRRLALLELDRAEYRDLKRLKLPKTAGLGKDVSADGDDLVPIRVLLAGLSGDRSYSGSLSLGLDRAIQNNVPFMGAYATALIELEGKSAVEAILNDHLANQTLPIETREKLLEALAIQHKTASGPTRRAISRGVANLVQSFPELKEAAARQFGLRSNWAKAGSSSRAKNP